MQRFIVSSIVCVAFIFLSQSASAQTDKQPSPVESAVEVKCQLPGIQTELATRVSKDQEARLKMIEGMRHDKEGVRKVDAAAHKLVVSVDEENKAWILKIVEKHGWLGKTLVGESGAHDAWLLVQHADQDLPFQKKCLALMTAMPEGEVSPTDVAYLTDRILSAESKPQRYGTQCEIVDGKAVVKSVEEPENLNQRRKELGLQPIEEYLKFVESMYVKPSNETSKNTENSKSDSSSDQTNQ